MAARRGKQRSWEAKPPGRYHHGDLRRALVEASIETIAEEGVSALTLRGVARRVGVSHAASRHHFADKTDLLAAIAMAGFDALADALRGAIADFTEPWERFRWMGVAYVRFAVAHASQFRVMFGRELAEASPPPLRDYRNPATELLIEVAAEAMSTRGRADPEAVGVAAIAALSLVHGLVMLQLDGFLGQVTGAEGSDEEFDAMARTITEFVVGSVARGL